MHRHTLRTPGGPVQVVEVDLLMARTDNRYTCAERSARSRWVERLGVTQDPAHDRGVRILVPVQEGRHCGLSSIARLNDQQRPGREGPGEGLFRILLGPALGRFRPSGGGE